MRVCVCFSMNIVKWSSQGMLRLTQEAMNELFQPTITNIVKHIGEKKHTDTCTDCRVANIRTLTLYTNRFIRTDTHSS